jgi:hypothetical protein
MIQAARVCLTISGLPDQPAVGARRPRLIDCAEGNNLDGAPQLVELGLACLVWLDSSVRWQLFQGHGSCR